MRTRSGVDGAGVVDSYHHPVFRHSRLSRLLSHGRRRCTRGQNIRQQHPTTRTDSFRRRSAPSFVPTKCFGSLIWIVCTADLAQATTSRWDRQQDGVDSESDCRVRLLFVLAQPLRGCHWRASTDMTASVTCTVIDAVGCRNALNHR